VKFAPFNSRRSAWEHFFAGPPAANNYARRVREMNGEEGTPADNDDLPDRHPDECRSTQDPLYRCGDEPAPEDFRDGAAHPGSERLQIVADSHDRGRAAAG
jgi:hypothetical protein